MGDLPPKMVRGNGDIPLDLGVRSFSDQHKHWENDLRIELIGDIPLFQNRIESKSNPNPAFRNFNSIDLNIQSDMIHFF